MLWLIIGGAVLASAAIFVVVPALVVRAMAPALQRRVSAVYQPDQVLLQDLRSLTLGLESRGVMQARGNGALVLTARELHFFQFSPERDLRIPLDTITEVDTVRSHLGKSLARKLLHVSFTAGGKPDSMAWYVTDLDAWLDRVNEVRKATPSPASPSP